MPHKLQANRKLYIKKYANSEKGKAKIKEWREKHRDRIRELHRKYWNKNKDKLRKNQL